MFVLVELVSTNHVPLLITVLLHLINSASNLSVSEQVPRHRKNKFVVLPS